MNFSKTIFLVGLTASLFSCTKETLEEDDKNDLPDIPDSVFYSSDVKTIIDNNCVGCHAGSSPSAGVDLSNYTNVKFQTEQGNLISRMNNTNNPMPPSGVVPAVDLQKIDKWLSDGLKED